jgi:molybdopterin synthase catalytic subunit
MYCEVMTVPLVAVTSDLLAVERLTAVVADTAGAHGAVASFVGLVRRSNQDRSVLYLEYEAYEPLAVKTLERIRTEARTNWPSAVVGLHHRVGTVRLGEASVAIVAASPHRGDAFAACRYAIERVKQIVPIWKHEHFAGGDVWLEGATADPDDEEARRSAYRSACA